MKRLEIAVLLCLAFGVCRLAAAAEGLAIIVNQSNPISSLSAAEVRGILMGDQRRWADGRLIEVLLPSDAQPVKRVMLRDAVELSSGEFIRHWRSQVYGLRASRIPRSSANDGRAVRLVVHSEAALAVVSPESVTDDVKVVFRIGDVPADGRLDVEVVFIGGVSIPPAEVGVGLARRIVSGQAVTLGDVRFVLAVPKDGPKGLGRVLPALDLDGDAFRRGWLRRVLNYDAKPPRQLSPLEGMAWVRQTPNALMLIPRDALPANAEVNIMEIERD